MNQTKHFFNKTKSFGLNHFLFFTNFFLKSFLGNIPKEENIRSAKTNSSSSSSITTAARSQTPYLTWRKEKFPRPHSAINNNQQHFYFNHFDQLDSAPPLTKSALIYQLIRSRLQANLAKSISNTKEKFTNKEYFHT